MLWRNVYIECDDYCHDQLVGFLTDRPAIHAGIKALRVSISLESASYPNRNRDLASFYKFCDYVATNLTLETFHVCVHFSLEEVDKVARCEGKFAFLSALREINVQHKFGLNGVLYVSEHGSGKPPDRIMMLAAQWLKRGLKPYSLLESEPTTEQERYLQERNVLVHRFRKHERKMAGGAKSMV